MMIGEIRGFFSPSAVDVPHWSPESMAGATDDCYSPATPRNSRRVGDQEFEQSSMYSNLLTVDEDVASLQRYLPSGEPETGLSDFDGMAASDYLVNVLSSDEFRMFEFKVRRCSRSRSHDWTDCPFAHQGEKARRRDPRKFQYSGVSCPEHRKANCKRGDSCEFAHGVFECWLHPDRYRTQPCKDGIKCRRRVCFFAHTPEQLRSLSRDSPSRLTRRHSNSSSSPSSLSPSSPFPAVHDVVPSLGSLRIGGIRSMPATSSLGRSSSSSASGLFGSPTGFPGAPLTSVADCWVESGRTLRAEMFEKLWRENVVEAKQDVGGHGGGDRDGDPDVEWVSHLLD